MVKFFDWDHLKVVLLSAFLVSVVEADGFVMFISILGFASWRAMALSIGCLMRY